MNEAALDAAESPGAEVIIRGVRYLDGKWPNGRTYLFGQDPELGHLVRDRDDPDFLVTGADLMDLEANLNAAAGAGGRP